MAFNPQSQYDTIRTNQAIKDFYEYSEDYETRPPYQRKVVWEKPKQQALMDSLFRRYYIPSVVLREVQIDENQSKWEVVGWSAKNNIRTRLLWESLGASRFTCRYQSRFAQEDLFRTVK